LRRFEAPQHLASDAGTTPRVHASGDKTRDEPLRPDVNRYAAVEILGYYHCGTYPHEVAVLRYSAHPEQPH
jgi:hypothetical protein